MSNRIDHFTIGTHDLHAGIAAMELTLGVTLPRGGKHPDMSTHNCLTATGEDQFFEMIAIDPDAPPPQRTRWFTLDEARTKTRLAMRPRALCWVVATDDLDALVASSPIDLGEIITLKRDALTWRLSVPKNGSLGEQGLIPAFIEWPDGPHPAASQRDIGIRLNEIIVSHPNPDGLEMMFKALQIEGLATITQGERALSFDVTTPKGRVILD